MRNPLALTRDHRRRQIDPALLPPSGGNGDGKHEAWVTGSGANDKLFATTPLLAELARTPQWIATQPLADFDGQFPLHFFNNLVAFLKAGTMLGLDPAKCTAFYKGEGYRYIDKQGVITAIRGMGFAVRPVADITLDYLQEIDNRAREHNRRTLVCEDGGYFSPGYAVHPELAERLAGVVEQTSRGERLLRKVKRKPRFPVLSVPGCQLKRKLEPDFVADGAVRALQTMLPNLSLRNLRVAVLGLGDLGRALVVRSAENCAPPTMFDLDPEMQTLGLKLCGRLCATAVEAIKDADVVFGVTGHTSINADLIPYIRHGAKLVSVSSNDTEFDKIALGQMGKGIPLYRDHGQRNETNRIGTRFILSPDQRIVDFIADGFPVNFFGDFGGMGDDIADLVMSILFVCMVEAAQGMFLNKKGIIPGAVDELVRKHNLCARFLRYHR